MFYYHHGENVVTLKSTLDDVNNSNTYHFDPVNEITIKLEDGRLESDKSEVDYFVDFINKLAPKIPIRAMTYEELKGFLPDIKDSKRDESKHFENPEFYFRFLNYYRDFYRSYVQFLTKNPMGKKEFVDMMRSVDDVPDFVKNQLGWTKATMIEEAMIFFIFNKSCENQNGPAPCENFTDKKCSKCKIVSFCSTECFDKEWNHGHHGHCCGNMVRMQVSEMTRSMPKYFHNTISMLFGKEDIVTLETFCRELFRRIVLVFMELLADTPLMLIALKKRNLEYQITYDKENNGFKPVEGRDPKYDYNRRKIPTVLKDYKGPVIKVKTLEKQMEKAYGRENFLSWTLENRDDVQRQMDAMVSMVKAFNVK